MHYLPATTSHSEQKEADLRLHKVAQAVGFLEHQGRWNAEFTALELELIEDLETALAVRLAILRALRSKLTPNWSQTAERTPQNIEVFGVFD